MRDSRNLATYPPQASTVPSDSELLVLFQTNSGKAWRLFIDRYADGMFCLIRSLGFDYDQAMDRFTFVCEKLCEKDFRRLKAIKYAGSRGDLTPWVRQVVKRLCINWAWSEDGRKRLLKPIALLGPLEQRVFELYFWQGLTPSRIDERLRQEHFSGLETTSVFDALEQILSQISEKKLWRLVSNLARSRGSISLDEADEESGMVPDVAADDPNPETELIQREQDQILQRALEHLPPKEVLMLQFRFEHALSISEIAELMRVDETDVRKTLDECLKTLRKIIKNEQ
ncbi:MAG: RNA polymerase sigma factor [Acidobacteriota bacterium]